MYLSSQKCFKLDEIVKSFEVALRTYVSVEVYKTYDTYDQFRAKLEEINNNHSTSAILNSGYIKAKLGTSLRDSTSIYNSIKYSANCKATQDYCSDKVLYVSQVFDMVLIFFNPLFHSLSNNFETNHEFIDLSMKYAKLRNDLSHPASSKIKIVESKTILQYIEKLLQNLDSENFWYYTKNDIIKLISEYKRVIDNKHFEIHNLDQLSIDYRRLILREKEIQLLSDYILGKDEFYRKAGSVVLYGYGGVGKTAIVTEFVNQIAKKKTDNDLSVGFDFVLYFTSKEEKLDVKKTTGDLIITQQRREIIDYNDFLEKLFNYLSIESIDEYKRLNKSGLIVIDNIETFSESDKEKITSEFIKMSPRDVQFIITSRNEEKCEETIHIDGFRSETDGLSFISKYIEENELNIELTTEDKINLIGSSNGNTLILILSLTRLNLGKTSMDQIIFELDNVSAQNTEKISNFMYKNTFDSVIRELELKGYNPVEILQIISYYGEPIDLLTINLLCKERNIKNVEFICKELSSRLILNKNIEFYELNEFASKFVFIKMKPNMVELNKLRHDIKDRKALIQDNLERLNFMKNKHENLEEIINEWKPRTYVDKLAFAEVYNLYTDANKIRRSKSGDVAEQITKLNEKFINYELSSPHPYIRYQKARCFQLFLKENIFVDTNKEIVNSCFEEAIMGVEYDYTFIQQTQSYPYILWMFGQFKMKYYNDPKSALKYFQESKLYFEEQSLIDETYYKVLANSADALFLITKEDTDFNYIKLYADVLKQLNENKSKYDSIRKYLSYHKKLSCS